MNPHAFVLDEELQFRSPLFVRTSLKSKHGDQDEMLLTTKTGSQASTLF